MKTLPKQLLIATLLLLTVRTPLRAALLVSDNFNVTGSGSGFGLNAGVNSGINPPTTRLTGAVAANLRYINTGTKATTAYTITSNKLRVTSAVNPGRFVLSADGTTPFDFAPSLGTAGASPANPVVYDISISMDNDSTGIQRFSFALGVAEGDAFSWDFGFQVYRAASGNNFYTIGKRIDTKASGLASDLNSAILTMGANTYGTEITILMRVTDAGSQSSGFNSRVQLSTNGGSTWFYDTATDSDLAGTGWRLNGAGRILMWDVAPDAGNVTYDNFTLNWNSGPRTWNGAGTTGNWSTGANWGGVSPVNGSTLTFAGTTRQVNTNDISGLNVPWFTLNNGGFTLYGNFLTNSSAITNASGVNTIKAGLAWSTTAAKSWRVASGSELALDNANSIEVNGDHTLSGGGTLRLKGSMNLGQVTGASQAFIVNEGKHILDGATYNSRGGYRLGALATGAAAQTILTNGAALAITASSGNMRIGDSANPNTARFDMNNSTLTLSGGTLAIPYVAGATGVLAQVGGTVSVGTISFSDAGAGSGTYTILNGTLEAVQIKETSASGAATITFDNATLRTAPGANATFLTGLDSAQILSGGLIADVTTDVTVGQTLSGAGALAKSGGSQLTLTAGNSFSGGVTLNAGAISLGNDGALGSGTLTINGGTVLASGGARQIGNPITANANFTLGGTDALTFSGTANLGAASRIITVTSAANMTFSGVMSGTGGLTKDGSGPLVLSGGSANTFTGTTVVNAGVLALGKTAGVNAVNGNVTIGDGTGADKLQLNAANQIPDTAVISIAAGGVLDLNGFGETVATVSSGSGSSSVTLGSGALTVGDASDATFAGSITGTGSLTKQGGGKLTLTGASTYTGGTTVNSGAINAQNGAALGSGGTVTITAGTALEAQGGIAVSGVGLALNGTGISSGGALRNISGNNSWSGAVTLGSDARINSDSGTMTLSGGIGGSGKNLAIGGAANVTVSGAIATGAGALTKVDAGTTTLSGANTYSGNTTISAGTLAIGAGGSISSSANITISTGTTFDVSAVSYSLGGGQTLGRDATSGAGNVNGSMTLASGAKVSLQANGTGGTVGTLSVTGGLTLNANPILIAVSGNPLGLGTYALINYTGTKTGSFNVSPTISGSGLAMGLAGRIVETAGVISLQVYLPAHGIGAVTLNVVENDLANTTESVTVTATTSINGLGLRAGSSRGDYTVQFGTSGTDDLTTGAMITSVAENGRDHGEDSGINYCTVGLSSTSSGYFIPSASSPDGKEYNINVAAALFPYTKYLGGYARNSSGTAGGPNNLLTASPGLTLGTHFVDNGGGLSTVNLTSLGINSQTDGVLLVTSGANDDNFASTGANADGTWTVRVKDNGTNGAAFEQDPVSFVFIPKTNTSVISGKFEGDDVILMYSGTTPQFSITSVSNGSWRLSIPGFSPSKGVLIVSPEGGDGANQDNILSYQASGNDWIIQTRDIPGLGLQALTGPVASFVFIPGPQATLVSPANGANVASGPTLKVNVASTFPGNLSVRFYGHRAAIPGPGKDFLIPVLPDTQNYARESSGSGQATKEMWFAQTDWILANRVSENIPFVATLGDCVNNADVLSQWKNATNAMYRLERQADSLLLDGVPYGITVGNHDQDPNGDPDGSTAYYNQYFGTSHFSSRSYYGGNYSSNNDSWYDFFSAGGMDFLVFSFEYGRYGTTILDWANGIIAANPNHRVIVLTHHAGDDTPDDTTTAPFSTQGSAIYNALKSNPNFFLMLGGHVFNEGGEGRRSDTFNGKTVKTLISDYQGRFNGGNGLMRLMYFSPSNNLVSVKTYSPYTGNFETDANSQFSFTYNMQPNGAGSAATAYAALGTNSNVVPGAQSTFAWGGLTASKPYEWYVTVTTDEGDYATSTEWNFKTTSGYSGLAAPVAGGDKNGNGIPETWEAQYGITNVDGDNDGDGQSNRAEYYAQTNPTNAASVFRILSAQRGASGQLTVTWSSVGGVRYRVQYSDLPTSGYVDLERDSSSETDPGAPGVPSQRSYTEPAAADARFYRIRVVQ